MHRQDESTSYSDWKEAPGVLYVFDVPEWDAQELPRHGMLVDLARGPDVFTRSARIQAQKACLIASDRDDSGGDLMRFLAHPPIQVEWPMTGCEGASSQESALFPSPAVDEWYVRLLFLPLVTQVWREEPHWRVAHPVDLSVNLEHLEPTIYAVQFKPLQPPLLYPWLIEPALKMVPDEASLEKAARFLQTVPILLEAPVIALELDRDVENWNQEKRVNDLPTVLGVVDWASDQISEEPVLLNDVLFELSPLEVVGWTDLLRPGAEMPVPRAVHLVREEQFAWRLQVFFQLAPKEQVSVLFEEPAAIQFNLASRRFDIEIAGRREDVSAQPIAAKCLFVTLLLLGALSDPNTAASAESCDPASHAVLKRAPDIGLGIRYYVMRDPKTGDPFIGAPVERAATT